MMRTASATVVHPGVLQQAQSVPLYTLRGEEYGLDLNEVLENTIFLYTPLPLGSSSRAVKVYHMSD